MSETPYERVETGDTVYLYQGYSVNPCEVEKLPDGRIKLHKTVVDIEPVSASFFNDAVEREGEE